MNSEALERYIPQGNTEVAQEIWDKGLIWLINLGLEDFGYAVGVTTNEPEVGKVTEMFVARLDEVGEIDEEAIEAGHERFVKTLAERRERGSKA